MSPSDSPDHPGSILYHSESSEVHKPVTGQELFFAVSYTKPALIMNVLNFMHTYRTSDLSLDF